MRTFLRLLSGLVFLAFLLTAPILSAAPPPARGPVPVLKVGYLPLPGELYKDERGLYRGIAFEYLSTVASYMGCALTFTEGNDEENLQRLQAGEVDLVPTATPMDDSGLASLSLGPSIGYITFRAGDREMAERLEQAIQAVDAVAPFYRFKLLERYRPAEMPLELTPEEREYLKEKKVLHGLTSEGQTPYTYFKDGEHMGIIADIMKLIEADLGIAITAIPLSSQESRLQAMALGKIDIICDQYDDYNWANENEVWLTKPYLKLDYVAVMNRGRPLPDSPVIACARGHFYNRAYTEYHYPTSQVRYYPTLQDCLRAVNDGDADIVFTKTLTVQNDIYAGGYLNLYTPGTVVFSHLVSMGVSRYADPRLLSILNKEIAHLSNQQIASILTRHAHSMGEYGTIFSLVYLHPVRTIALVGLICLALVLAMVLFMYLKRRYHQKIYHLAYTHANTGLHNLNWLIKELPALMEEHRALRQEGRLFLMAVMADKISFMKESYDLKVLVESLMGALERVRWKNPWMLTCSINGEGTCLYFLCREDEDLSMRQAAEKFIRDAGVVNIGQVPTNFTYRIGLISIPNGREVPPKNLLDCCSTAVMEAIASDRNLVVYDEDLSARIAKRQEMENLMTKALTAQEFQVWLQPKYDLATHNTLGAEALVRWDSPELGFLLPDAFMDIFERNGFAVELDYYVLEKICQLQSARLKAGLPALPISVNQSGLHITEQGYLGRMREIMDKWQLVPGVIELEITETAFIDFTTKEQREDAAQIIDDLQAIGYTLSMDDFCTGYSSLSMLQNLPMNVMKIDRSILWSAETSPRSMSILRHVIALGKALSMSVLVEGIETKEQEELLLALGCDSGQGYLYSKPMPAHEFYDGFLSEHS